MTHRISFLKKNFVCLALWRNSLRHSQNFAGPFRGPPVFFVVLAVLFLSACSIFNSSELSSVSIATGDFTVGELTAPRNLKPVDKGVSKDGLPESFVLNLMACVTYTDRPDASIPNTDFVIEYESNFQPEKGKKTRREELEVRSDPNGCIQWEEEYKWKFVKRPVWIGLKRSISTKNNAYPGRVDIVTAVNPWLGESDKDRAPLLDMRYSGHNSIFLKNRPLEGRALPGESDSEGQSFRLYRPEGLAFLSERSKGDFLQLWASKVDMQIRRFARPAEGQGPPPFPAEGSTFEEIKEALKRYEKLCEGLDDTSCYRRYFRVEITIPLELRGYDTDGSFEKDFPLSGGRYDIEIQMIADFESGGKEEKYRLHENVCRHENVDLHTAGGQAVKYLSPQCLMKIPYWTRAAEHKLLVEVWPAEGSNLPFKRFQGVYSLGDLGFSSERKSFLIDSRMDDRYRRGRVYTSENEISFFENMNIQNIYDFSKSDDEHIKKSFYIPNLYGENDFKMSNIGVPIKNVEECSKTENPVIRTVSFVGEVCLHDNLLLTAHKNNPSRVFIAIDPDETSHIEEYLDNDGGMPVLNGQGCLDVHVPIEHRVYDRQRYIPVDIHFVLDKGGVHGKVRAMLNPWQRAFQAHQDARASNPDDIRSDTTGVSFPELVINQFKSVNLFPSFGLDKFLNIHLYHRIYFLFQPFVKRHDDVSFGLNHRARALLRDGYYMVRLMLLRNPQETLKASRIYGPHDLSAQRERLVPFEDIDYEKSDYFTHTDMIAKAEANFMNLYMPLYISQRQLYYIASRNLISIEVVPVDPAYFKYELEENGACRVDEDKMTKRDWRPFFDHELKNHPYVGPFNVQNWTNWNVLRRAEGLDSDAVISKTKTGSKYRKFFLGEEYYQGTQGPAGAQTPGMMGPDGAVPDSSTAGGGGAQAGSGAGYSTVAGRAPGDKVDFVISEACDRLGEDNSYKVELESPGNQGSDREEWATPQRASVAGWHKLNNGGYNEREASLVHIPMRGRDPSFLEGGEATQENIEKYERFHKQIRQECGPRDDVFIRSSDVPGQALPAQLVDQARKDAGEGNVNILKEFADKNALRLVELDSAGEGALFSEDMTRALEKIKKGSYFLDDREILPFLPDEAQNILRARFLDECEENGLLGVNFADAPFIGNWLKDRPCRHEILRAYISDLESSDNTEDILPDSLPLASVLKMAKQTDTWRELQREEFSADIGTLQGMIDQRLLTKEPDSPEALSFAGSLCHFWFDSYIPDYLQRDQMLSAFTDYVTKLDLYQIWEGDFKRDDKDLILWGFVTAIGLSSAQTDPEESLQQLQQCHIRYSECVVRDHCRLNSLNSQNREYCDTYTDTLAYDDSCKRLLNEECERDSDFHPLCQKRCRAVELLDPIIGQESCGVSEGQCHKDLGLFCRTNPDHSVCYKLSNRCIVNYRSCLQRGDTAGAFDPDQVLQRECLVTETRLMDMLSQKVSPALGLPESELADYIKKCKNSIVANPLKTCLENPYRFFKFESKMAVHELSDENPEFAEQGGRSFGFNVTGNFSLGSYMNWAAHKQTSMSGKIEGGINFTRRSDMISSPASDGFFNAVKQWFSFRPSLSLSQSMQSNEGNSSRRAVDVRAGEGMYYAVESPSIELKATRFQKCLVVKPRPNAFFARYIADENFKENNVFEEFEGIWTPSAEERDFKKYFVSRPGLLLCNPVEERDSDNAESFIETYYYISQDTRSMATVQFLNLFDLINRPLVHILRGRREFVKFYHLHKGIIGGDNGNSGENGGGEAPPHNMFVNYPHPVEEAVGLSLRLREFNETGFHFGIYDYADQADQELDAVFTEDDKGILQDTFEWLRDWSLFPVPAVPKNQVPLQE